MGVASGCGCNEVYRFPNTILIPTPFVSVFVHFFYVFRSFSSTCL